MHIGGTSASAPSFAAFVALLNDARLAAGKPVLGFLSPLIYVLNGVGFNDITAGNAPGCGTPGFNVSISSLIRVWRRMALNTWLGDSGVGPGDGLRDT